MKKKSEIIKLWIDIEGKEVEITFTAENLRNWLTQLKIEPNQEKVVFNFDYNGKKYSPELDVKNDIPKMKMAVKYAQLLQNIIPKNIAQYLTDYTQAILKETVLPIIGREHEIEKMWFYISQEKRNNVFVIGLPEVGKTAIAKEIVRQISTGECPRELFKKRVILLKVNQLLKIRNQIMYEYTVNKIMNFIEKNKEELIIFIDDAIYMKTDELLIYMLYQYIKVLNVPIIATAREEEYEKYFLGVSSLEKYINYVYVEEPEYKELKPMIRNHIKKLKKEYKINISNEMIDFAIYTSDLAEISSVNPGKVINNLDRAFLEAKRHDKQVVDKKSILKCYNIYRKYYVKKPEKEKWATAYHEAGHYLTMIMNENHKDIKSAFVSILPMMTWEGVTVPYIDSEMYSEYSKEYYIDQIAIFLAGRVAEKKFTNTETVGASNDLAQANAIAKAMLTNFGFSKNPENRNRQYNTEDYYLMTEKKKTLIDKEIQEFIDEGWRRAEIIIEDNEVLLEIIAGKLVEEEILIGQQLEKICENYKNK